METCALSGVLHLERVRVTPILGTSNCSALRREEARDIERKKLGRAMRSQFFGRQQLTGRIQPIFDVGYSQGCNLNRQLRSAYTTTEKIVGGLTQVKETGKRRLILLRHAKSSWADRSLKGISGLDLNFFPLFLDHFHVRGVVFTRNHPVLGLG